jgi:predicted nucleotidyltransferase
VKIMAIKAETPAHDFYAEVLKILKDSKFTFMVAGGFAVNSYTQLRRPTKDIDIFVKAGDYPKILNKFTSLGYKTQVQDERWIAKIFKGKFYVDLIFGSSNLVAPVTDDWFKDSKTAKFFNYEVRIPSVTDLIVSKVFIQNRDRYDGADVAHLILLKNNEINWERLLCSLEQYWEVLLIHLLNFRFVYPSEREKIPSWLLRELLSRLHHQFELPTPRMKVCRGRMFSVADYTIDVTGLGFADVVGGENERKAG